MERREPPNSELSAVENQELNQSNFQFPPRTTGPSQSREQTPTNVLRKKKSFSQLNPRHGNIASDDSGQVDWEDLSEGLSSVSISVTPSLAEEEARQQRDVDEWFEEMQDQNDGLSLSSTNEDPEDSFDPHDADDHAVHLTRFFHEDKRRSMFVHEKHRKHSRVSDDVFIHGEKRTPRPDDYHWVMSTPLGSPEVGRSAVAAASTTDVSAMSNDLDYTFDSTPSLQHTAGSAEILDSRDTSRLSLSSTVDTIIFEDDFAYLAGLLADEDTKTTAPQTESRLDPGLRDSSIIFLGSYVHRTNESQSHFPIKIEAQTPKNSRSSISSYLGGHQHTDSAWTSTGTYSSDASPRRGHGLRQTSITGVAYTGSGSVRHSGLFELSPMRENRMRQELHEPAADEIPSSRQLSGLAESQNESPVLRQIDVFEQRYDDLGDFTDNTQASFPVSASFKRMVVDSSMNTLQLAGFIMQFDRMSSQTRDQMAVAELERAKNVIIQLYEYTRRTSRGYVQSSTVQQQIIAGENRARGLVASSLWTMILLAHRDPEHSQHYDSIFQGMLDMEWLRRSTLYEGVDDYLAIQLWA
jgi:hypothetical protein